MKKFDFEHLQNDKKRGLRPKRASLVFIILMCVISVIGLTACADEMEEPDITADYLQGEFADQLVTDGAEIITGSVNIFYSDDNVPLARIDEKQIVANSSRKEGYYIADANNAYERALGADCRIVYLNEGTPIVGNVETFIKKYNDDPDSIYEVYCFSESCELIIAVDPKEKIK